MKSKNFLNKHEFSNCEKGFFFFFYLISYDDRNVDEGANCYLFQIFLVETNHQGKFLSLIKKAPQLDL